MSEYNLPLRLSRLRKNAMSRSLVRETRLHTQQLIAPLFISEYLTEAKEISAMPGQFQLGLNCIPEEIEALSKLGIPAVLLFGIPKKKDACGSESMNNNGIIQQAIKKIKSVNSDMLVITDLCFCEYTDHGHCGVLDGSQINIASTLELLGKQAVSHAEAGADWVAPSGMTDGMVLAIRQALDTASFHEIPILSYSAKYCSCLYGPFREAAQGAPQFGDRKAYQMDPANSEEAVRETRLDLEEGADMIMVKPAGFYLDIIYKLKQHFTEVPLCAYQVSGEYSMIKNAAKNNLIHEEQAMIESLIAIKRAGADFIISYFAKDMAKLLNSQNCI
ncbi:porphobilinogen synthase [Legionella pneumophila]|uniref:Delta-aminolevulinic acid dehydratase n=1 Tax=Legionella pneumophila subsp. pascullei TaxID=91890 RepID=A0AAX2J0K1_LEGPN|nr:porphobilinogen synthase [Legionella pneumophila]AMP89549.1 delta-aminolevulinic acid dehydratase [Legionella pneumophila subsp. pascullei]AMP92785.1 delta-aminolevulinic acid dehydratase [Legionella pneumophila subsp. pascullei]AMP95751.1 delta-aminolevulinic acid dehydratase [Legionella pneumophila subsp. pascullei]SQG90664.1 porphobilinogen synthase [Legionella pneumophila subsp. pascullei]VEH07209.1 porphobilinogen synthase [Legionella pneumophila subsp. pascullei]